MSDSFGSFDNFAGLESGNYNKFYTTHVVRRSSQAPNKFDDWNNLSLPLGSVLHTISNFDTLVGTSDGMPNTDIPVVVNEKLPIFLKVHTQLASETSIPFGVKETYVYKPNTLRSHITHFFQTHKRYHQVLSDRMLGTMGGVLTWVDYSPLNEVKVTGSLSAYRKFDVIFRTILDMVTSIGPNRYHYIVLPQSDHVYSQNILKRTFKELSQNTLNGFLHDPSAFPLIHALGYVFGQTKPVDTVPYKEDVKILGKDNEVFNTLHSTSLIERLNPAILSSINLVFVKDNKAVIYNLQDLQSFAEDPNFYNKFYRHLMRLRLNKVDIPEHLDVDSDQFDTYVDTVVTSSEKPLSKSDDGFLLTEEEVTQRAQGGIKLSDLKAAADRAKILSPGQKTISDKDAVPIPVQDAPPSFEEKIRTASLKATAPLIQVEPKKEARRNDLLENHLKVTLNGKVLGELIQTPPPQAITPKTMGFITSAPEPSYQKSSLTALDKAYQDHGYHHEMAKVLGSLAKHGLFINKVEETKVHTEMDRTTTYRLNVTDLNGKTHHVKYTVPDVDANGLMKLSGIEYRLTKQIVNLPIVKTSPVRVNLSSYYNKVIVERIQSKRYSYEVDTAKLIISLKNKGLLKAVSGSSPLPTKSVPYDYTSVGRSFTEITVSGYDFHFKGNGADYPDDLHPKLVGQMEDLEKTYGIYVGEGPIRNQMIFWQQNNQIHLVTDGKAEKTWSSFHAFLYDVLGEDAKPERTPMEWTQANIINQTIPLVYILSYKFGLRSILNKIRLEYQFYQNKGDMVLGVDDIAISFADGTLVFNRYPLSRSLIACGLLWADLRRISFRDMEIPDTYPQIFAQKKMTVGVLKGLNGFFDFFVDPITETVLEKMQEPTTFDNLLLRATVMLTDYHAEESSSVKLHRFRLYERFNGILYNEIYRSLSNHRNNPSSKKSFSINPEAVFQKIVQDATVSPNEVINPVHEVKQKAIFTFTGGGGRMGRSFTPKDLIYPQDGLGVISDNVPDSGKVGITSYLSASPNIDDIHGIPKSYKPGDTLEPPQILSIGSMVMPGGTTDDGKRNNYLNIQISHYVPNHDDGETLAVRTGYESVLPHLSSDVFSASADDDGIVESIDDKQKVLKVRYRDTPIVSLRSLKLPYLDHVLDTYLNEKKSFGFLIPDTEVSTYPMGGVFGLTRKTYGRIVDRLRCDTVSAIPDKDVARKQSNLIQDLEKGRYQALYYIRFTPIGNTLPGIVKSYSFADVYSQNSGAYLLQKRLSHVKAGDRFKAGDILTYNQGFFCPDPLTKQVTMKHGVIATVALIEKSSNHEDACEISRSLSERLKMTPCHQREVITKNDALILGMVKVGDHVETSDTLCVISDEYLVGTSLKINSENLDIFEKLSRQTPAANYTGTICKIRILYGCDRDKLSDSLKSILKTYEKEVRDNFKALNSDPHAKLPEKPGWVAPGSIYAGIDFTDTTVILEFMIEETLSVAEGDKICAGLSSKSIVSHVSEKPHYSESGIELDVLFSTTSVINRIVNSPFLIGIAERNMDKLKEKVLSLYFD